MARQHPSRRTLEPPEKGRVVGPAATVGFAVCAAVTADSAAAVACIDSHLEETLAVAAAAVAPTTTAGFLLFGLIYTSSFIGHQSRKRCWRGSSPCSSLFFTF